MVEQVAISFNGTAINDADEQISSSVTMKNLSTNKQTQVECSEGYYSIADTEPTSYDFYSVEINEATYVYQYQGISSIIKDVVIKDYSQEVEITLKKQSRYKYKIENNHKSLYIMKVDKASLIENSDNSAIVLQEVLTGGLSLRFLANGTYSIDIYVLNDDNYVIAQTTKNISINTLQANRFFDRE